MCFCPGGFCVTRRSRGGAGPLMPPPLAWGGVGGTPTLMPMPPSTLCLQRSPWASSTVLNVVGVLLLAVGAGLLAAAGGLSCSWRATTAPAAPAPAVTPAAGSNDTLPVDVSASAIGEDCTVALANRTAYTAAAAAAEAALFGSVASAAPDTAQLQQQVAALPRLLLGTVFWVLVSEGGPGGRHSWSDVLPAAAAAQVAVANAALEAAGLALRLDGVLRVPAPDALIENCLGQWDWLEQQLAPTPDRLHVVLCEPPGNGAAAVLGGGGGGGANTILLRRSALWQSKTSALHQVGGRARASQGSRPTNQPARPPASHLSPLPASPCPNFPLTPDTCCAPTPCPLPHPTCAAGATSWGSPTPLPPHPTLHLPTVSPPPPSRHTCAAGPLPGAPPPLP